MGKLLLPSKSLDVAQKSYTSPTRIRESLSTKLEELKEETGLSKIDLIDKLCWYAIGNIELVATKEYLKNEEEIKFNNHIEELVGGENNGN